MSASAPGSPHGAAPPGGDPSMEDILASIRRILSEDDTPSAPAAAAAPRDDVLSLDSSMLVEDEPLPPAIVMAPPVPVVPPPPQETPTMPLPAQAEPSSTLMAPEVAAAAAASVGSLLRTLASERQQVPVRSGGPTIEDLVREEIRPLLKTWLDANLPAMVERLVRVEIERVVGRALP